MKITENIEKLYLEPKGENNLQLHPLANIESCMKSYEKKIGILISEQQLQDLMHKCWLQSKKFYTGKANVYFYDFF